MPNLAEGIVGRVAQLAKWEQSQIAEAAKRHRLFLIRHLSSRPNRLAIVFVHGIGGDPIGTWQRFPELVFEAPELANFDVTLFRYASGFLTNLFPGTTKLDIREKSLDLANDIRSLFDEEHYEGIVIVAHSMGGIIGKFAIRQLLELDAANARRILGLYMCGTPQYGSSRAAWPIRWLSPDLRLLAAFSADLADLQLFWNSRITTDPTRVMDQRFYLDERAIVGTSDRLVKRGSGVGALPYERIQTVNMHHTKLVKPQDAQDPVFRWLLVGIENGRSFRQPRILERIGASSPSREELVDEAPDLQLRLAIFLKNYFESTYLVEGGRRAGHRVGDEFIVIYIGEMVVDTRGRPIYATRTHKNYLAVRQVEEHVTICQLESLLYGDLPSPLDALPEPGDEVDLIPGETWKLFKKLEKEEKELSTGPKGDQHAARLVHLLIDIETMLTSNPDSYLAKSVLYMKGETQLALGRYDEAIHTFETYRERYPRTRDLLAKSRIEISIQEAELRRALAGTASPSVEDSVRLALLLLRRNVHGEEAISILEDALDRAPEIVRKQADETDRRLIAARLAVQAANAPTVQVASRFRVDDPARFRSDLKEFIEMAELSNGAKADLLRRLDALFIKIGSGPDVVQP